jgi:hypothetical protein
LELFKKCHYSKKKNGYTPTVQLAIVRHLCTTFLKFVFSFLPRDHTPRFCLLARIKWKITCQQEKEWLHVYSTESEEPNSATQVVADVLAQKNKEE